MAFSSNGVLGEAERAELYVLSGADDLTRQAHRQRCVRKPQSENWKATKDSQRPNI